MNTESHVKEDSDCEVIQGITTSNTTDSFDVVHMADETALCAQVPGYARATLHEAPGFDDLKRTLARPRALASGAFGTGVGNQHNVSLFTRANWRDAIGTSQFDRMVGIAGFRATIVLRVVATATPFHQGIAVLCFQYGTSNSPNVNGRRGLYPFCCTNLPHVKLDLSENSEVELRIPFVSAYEYIPVNANQETDFYGSNFGMASLTRISDFRLGGTQTSATWVMYISMEDVEFIGAAPLVYNTVTLQAGGADKEAKANGIASGILGAASQLAGQASRIPGFKGIGGQTEWYLNALSKSAASMGFSKPVDQTIVSRVAQTDYRGEAHVDLPNPGFMAGPFQTNKLRTDGTVGAVSDDQMDFDSILSVPAMISRREWGTTVAAGDLLYASHVSPSCYWFRETSSRSDSISLPSSASLTTNCFMPSHLMYLGSNFRYWRGGLKYTFQFAKTKMHGGRILITFTPDSLPVGNSGPMSNTGVGPAVTSGRVDMWGYSKMFDLSDSSTVEFEVPFMHQEPYCPFYGRTGVLTVHCISVLNSPTNTASTIDMLTYIQALPGFEFAVLKPSMLDSCNPRSNNTTGGGRDGVYLQAGGIVTDDNVSEYVIGEKFNSVKQLALLPDWHVFDQNNLTTLDITLSPYFKKNYVDAVTGTAPLPNTARAVWFGGKAGRVAEMFAFCNGSTNYTLLSDAPNGAGYAFTVYSGGNDNGNDVNTSGFGNIYNGTNNTVSGYQWYETKGSLRVVVPAFTRVLRVPFNSAQYELGANEQTGPGALTYTGVFTNQQMDVRLRNTSGATRRLAIGRAAGDDAYFSQYVGPPLCAFFQSTQSVSPNPSAINF